MKPTLYPNGFPSAYEELKTFYPVFYRDVFEMDAIWRAAGGGLDEIEDGVDAVVNNNFVSLMDTDALAQMETFLDIPLNQKRTLEARRKLVASYFIGGNHIGAREIKDITRAFTEGTCEVSFVGGTVYIHVKSDIKDTPPEDDYYYILRKKIPAHLGVYTNIEIEFSERLYVGSNALEGNQYDIVPPPPVGQSAAGELRTGSYITQSDRTGIDLHPQPGLSFETGLHAAAVVLESSKTAVDLPAPERRSAQNVLHARTGMVESSRTAADMILYSGWEDSAEHRKDRCGLCADHVRRYRPGISAGARGCSIHGPDRLRRHREHTLHCADSTEREHLNGRFYYHQQRHYPYRQTAGAERRIADYPRRSRRRHSSCIPGNAQRPRA